MVSWQWRTPSHPLPPPMWMQFCNSGISEMMVFLLFYLWPGSSPSVYDPPVGGLRLFFTQVLSPLLVCFCSSWLHHIDLWGFYTQGSSLVNMGLIQWRYNSNCRQSLKYHPVWIQPLISKFPSTSRLLWCNLMAMHVRSYMQVNNCSAFL